MRSKGRENTAFGIKEIAFCVIAILAILLIILKPCDGLGDIGHYAMGFTIITVAGWILNPFGVPNSVCGLFMLGSMIICGMPASQVFTGFSQNALWTLIPALFFGYALQKTGLGSRIATFMLKLFPANWISIIIVWVIIGVLLSLVTPSMTVRAVIMIPVALQCCKLYGLEPGSKSSSFMLLTAIFTAMFPGNALSTGNLTTPIVQGIFDSTPGLENTIDFDTWLKVSLLPVAIITVVTVILGYLLLRPDAKLSKAAFLENTKSSRFTGNELITAIILVAACAMFFTGKYHGVSNVAICLMAVVLLFAFGIIKKEDFGTAISWDLVIFIGSGLCLSSIFQASGLSDWLVDAIYPVMDGISENTLIFLLALTAAIFIWRFVDVASLMPTMVILAPIFAKLVEKTNINPCIFGLMLCITAISMFMSYTNMWILMGKKMLGTYSWKESQLFRYGLAFFIAALIGIAIAVPYWTANGLA